MSTTPRKRYAAPIADMVSRCLTDAFAKQGFAAVDVVTHWEEVVGAELAERCEPIRLVPPRRGDPDSVGTLLLRSEGPYAIEVQHLAPVILERINRYFGWRCVGRIVIRQGPVTGRRRRPEPPAEPAPETIAEVAQGLEGVADEGLKGSLARLGALVKGRVTRA